MPIYDLNDISYLQYDIKQIFEKIENVFDVDVENGKITAKSKIIVDKKYKWFSEECKKAFNENIPKIKSVHKDMYAIIETIQQNKTNKFDRKFLEDNYKYFKEFRLFNNKVKHYKDKEVKISLTSVVYMEHDCNRIDFYCNFKYKESFEAVRYIEFIELFLILLNDMNVIKIGKSD